MKRWSRYTTFAVTMLMVLALCAMQVVPVLADDGAPPPTETPEVVPPPTEDAEPEAAPTEPPAPEATPVATEVPAELQAPAPAEAAPSAAEEAAAEPETPAEVLAQVPAGTEIVVLDKNGKALPLASAAAAEAMSEGDPQWCPVGVTPGSPSCSPVYGSLQALVADVGVNFNPATNGVIWIENSTFASLGSIVFDGTSSSGVPNVVTAWANWSNYGLTFKGGWLGSGTTITTTPSTIQDALSILDWKGDITLSDIVFSGVTTGMALTVTTTKNITMTNVKVGKETGHNTGAGATLDNSSGTGNVTLTSSEFSYNEGGYGLTVLSKGTITLNTIDANSNGGPGAVLNNAGAALAKNVVLTNSIFSENTGGGVLVMSRGAITASNLIANSNTGGWGASLTNTAATTALGVTLTGSSQFKFNGSGLEVASKGAITLNNITANNSTGSGVSLNNATSPAGSTVTLTGTNTFNNNTGGTGITVTSAGAILLNNVTANNNSFGALLNNLSASSVAKTVTLNGVNSFSQNSGGGLEINSTGAVTLNKVTASNNAGGRGVYVDNGYLGRSAPQNVTIIGYGTFNSNDGTGLTIYSNGTLSLANLTANSNGGSGAVLDNYLLNATAPKAVTLTGNNTFSSNNNGDGLSIYSLGVITINNVIADGNNGGSGAFLNNSMPGAVGGITVSNTATYYPSFSYNGNSGIQAYSRGNIVLKDFYADGNGGTGVYLENTYGAASNITVGTTRLNWRNYMDDNFYSGMEIFTNGIVMLSNLYAYGNGRDDGFGNFYGYGLYVDNSTAATPKNVTLLGYNTFNNNYDGGVYIYTDGAILANNLRANNNRAGNGAYLDNNTSAAAPQNVTLNGYGDFSDNAGSGLEVSTFGAITLNKIYADGNDANGVYLDNYTGATQVKGVTINGYADIYDNGTPNSGYIGLYVLTRGAILIANLDAWNNDTGVYLDNYTNAAGSPVNPVTITGHTWADSSNSTATGYGYGLYIETLGAITLANLEADYNANWGAYLRNNFTGSVGAITITGYADASNNYGGDGLLAYTNRAITIANLYAEGNGLAGAILNNTSSGNASPQNVTLSGYNGFYDNGDTGLVVSTYGAITLNNVTANGNGRNLGSFGWGAYLDNCVYSGTACTATVVKGVTLNGTNNFYNNYQDGLLVQTSGIIKANNVTASGNGGDGAYLDNRWGYGYYGVTLTGSNTFDSNSGNGLTLWSNGVVSIGNLTANYNTGDGAYIDTYNDETPPGPMVTLTGNSTFIGNGDGTTSSTITDPGSGLVIYSVSVVSINNLVASNNTQFGAYLIAHDGGLAWGPFPFNLKLTGVNTLNQNGLDGLYFEAKRGNVDITKLTADNNGGAGVSGIVGGNLNITCGSMTNNGGYGWSLESLFSSGIINLKGVFSYGNGTNTNPGTGTFVYTRTCPLP